MTVYQGKKFTTTKIKKIKANDLDSVMATGQELVSSNDLRADIRITSLIDALVQQSDLDDGGLLEILNGLNTKTRAYLHAEARSVRRI